MFKNKKAFTLIELIVVMAVIGILVLLAIPKLMGYTKKANLTKFIYDTKQLEMASERYYIKNDAWPRLSDTAYTSEQIETFAQKIYDVTGKEITLDPNGKYYDIDYSKLQKDIKVFDNKEHYILQNPVGNVYALYCLSESGANRTTSNEPITNNEPEAVITMTPNTNILTSTNISWSYSNSTDIYGDKIVDAEWINKKNIYTTTGSQEVQLRVKDSQGLWSDWSSITFNVGASDVGKSKSSPDIGWQRLDDRNNSIEYSLWTSQQTDSGSYLSTKTVAGQISFKFYGTKFRIISQSYPDIYHQGSINVTVDGVLVGNYNENSSNQYKKLVYELTDLNLDIHTVVLSIGENKSGSMNLFLDAIDIDSTGSMMP